MAIKEIKTRIALRTGDFAYWTTGAGKDIELIKGEVCVCTVTPVGHPYDADGNETGNAHTAPTVLFKVCDTTGKKFADLKWTSALAADVYEWAKTAALYHTTEAITTTGDTKTYVGNAFTKVEWDATLNNGKGGLKFTKETQFATKAELDAAIAAFGGDLSNITDTDTRYDFSTEGDKLVVTKTVYTNGEPGATEPVGTYEFLTADEAEDIADGLIGKADITIKGANGLTGEDTFNVNAKDAKTITISHANTSDTTNLTADGRKYVTGLTFDDYGHVTGYTTGEEVDQTVPVYNIVKDDTSDYAATYHLTKDGVNVGAAINIPKDMVVKSGEVVELAEGQVEGYAAGTYIKLTLADATNDTLYIAVGELIEYVTSGSATGDMVYVSIDPTTHKVTATITDGTITEAKLHADVTAKLNKVWDAAGAAATAKEEAIAAAAKDAGDKATVVLGEAQKYADEKVAALAGDGNTTTLKAVADRVKGLEDANHISEVEADTGLKIVKGTNGANNKVAIDESVVFVLDCNW
jgi:hypothetical protein